MENKELAVGDKVMVVRKTAYCVATCLAGSIGIVDTSWPELNFYKVKFNSDSYGEVYGYFGIGDLELISR